MSEFDYRDVLLKAASLVEEGWWHRKEFFRGSEAVVDFLADGLPEFHCAVTALGAADQQLNGTPLDRVSQAEIDAYHRLCHLVGDPVAWNDTPGRTADEVAEALRRAADA